MFSIDVYQFQLLLFVRAPTWILASLAELFLDSVAKDCLEVVLSEDLK